MLVFGRPSGWLYACSTCLAACLCPSACMYVCMHVCLHAYLPAYLPGCLPTCLVACVYIYACAYALLLFVVGFAPFIALRLVLCVHVLSAKLSSGDSVVIVGCKGSGKTALVDKMIFGVDSTTVTSMKERILKAVTFHSKESCK